MKVKFVEEGPDWDSVSIYLEKYWLELDETYEAEFVNTDSFRAYPNQGVLQVGGFYYPETWFEIIENDAVEDEVIKE